MRVYQFCLMLFLSCSLSGLIAQKRSVAPTSQQRLRVEVSAEANKLIKKNGYSLDHGSNSSISYVVGDEQLLHLLRKANYHYEVEIIHGVEVATVGRTAVSTQMAENSCFVPLDAYPSYELYEELLEGFADNFPEVARLHELGVLPSGRRILALEITDNPDLEEEEPKLFYTSSMHGDELGGYHVTLRLIADLLCGYGENPELTSLINGAEIWINPLANPDGAYRNDNSAIINPSRGNANFVDLNRNYPDPDDGPHPDGQVYQPETEIFMAFAEQYTFDLSMNIHGGAEVFNYPWDTYAERTADDEWWIHVGRNYADDAQEAAGYNGYMDALENGITNGYDWYPIYGGRQDYVTYFQRGREATLEISNDKTAPPSQFDDLWNFNRRPMIDFLLQGTYGLRGTVTDSLTGQPIEASVLIPGHDLLNSDVFSKLPTGRYHRYLKAGTYTVLYSAEGYHPKLVTYSVLDDQPNYLHVQLSPIISSTATLENAGAITAAYYSGKIHLDYLPEQRSDWDFQLVNTDGREIMSGQIPKGQRRYQLDVGYLRPGIYLCRIHEGGKQKVLRFSSVVRKK